MIIRVETSIYIDVRDTNEGEEAASLLDSTLYDRCEFSNFPHGEVISLDVERFTTLTDAEIKERGLDE